MLNTVLFIILTIMRVVIAVLLTRTGLRKESRSVIWLAGLFYFAIIFSLSGAGVAISLPLVILLQGLGQACLIIFLHQTFYQGRPSPVAYFLGFLAIFVAAGLVVAFTGTVLFISTLASAYALVVVPQVANWAWNAFAARHGLSGVSQDKYVEDWIKSRYQLMVTYSLAFLIPCVLVPFLPVLPKPVVLLAFLLAFAVLAVQYLVWGMPEAFRKFLNRNYKAVRVDMDKILSMSEEEIMGLAHK